MRPDILNPLFAGIDAIRGVGPAMLKPLERLGITRVVDMLFHLPTDRIDRQRHADLDAATTGAVATVTLTPTAYRSGGPRAPFRVMASDAVGNHVALVFFGGNPGWAKKLLPLGEPRVVSGKLEQYGDAWQIVHPDHVLAPRDADQLPRWEAVYPLSQGISSKQLARLAGEAIGRAPALSEWIEPGVLAKHG